MMNPEAILAREPRVLSQSQREFYFQYGYLFIETLVSREWIDRLLAATTEVVGRLPPGDTAEWRWRHRLDGPADHHPVFWEFAWRSILPDLAVDLVGPEVRFQQSRLEFEPVQKDGGVEWHQDISRWPHVDDSLVTCGVYLSDCDFEDGPLAVVPGTHRGQQFSISKDRGSACPSAGDLAAVPFDKADDLTGPAGSVTVHHGRVVHGSRPNRSGRWRPLLLNLYSSADCSPAIANPMLCTHAGSMVRGQSGTGSCSLTPVFTD